MTPTTQPRIGTIRVFDLKAALVAIEQSCAAIRKGIGEALEDVVGLDEFSTLDDLDIDWQSYFARWDVGGFHSGKPYITDPAVEAVLRAAKTIDVAN